MARFTIEVEVEDHPEGWDSPVQYIEAIMSAHHGDGAVDAYRIVDGDGDEIAVEGDIEEGLHL